MGRAARWLRSLLGGKRADPRAAPAKEKRRWGFVKSFREKIPPQPPVVATDAAVLEQRKGYTAASVADEEEQSKRAIAVAAATAAVAEAAVAAAQAAAAVVRLTSSGRSVGFGGAAKRGEEAAVKIQAAFRGYLARRALKALRGLVKLQALVRGNIVRKQAAETLRCMQALVRVQARTRACRALRSERSAKASRSLPGPSTPEKYEQAIRASDSRTDKPGNFKKNWSKQASGEGAQQSSGWNWLDRWMEERYWDSREAARRVIDDEKNAKILEIDTGKPKANNNTKRSSSSNHVQSSCSTLTSDHNSRSFATVPDSPSKESSTAAQQSLRSPSSVECTSPLRFPVVVEAGEFGDSPQFFSASSRPGSSRRGPFTPAKSECSRSLFSGYSDYPNYMSNTQSSKAKVRSHSAPKQRPPEFEKSGSFKRVSGKEKSSSAAASAALHTKFANKAYPGSGRLDRLGMPLRY